MDLLEHLRRQFAYDAWANAEVLSAMTADESGASRTRPLQLLAHILSAERLWLERLKQQPQSFARLASLHSRRLQSTNFGTRRTLARIFRPAFCAGSLANNRIQEQ
jgi:uncharacterized damage-inducible protein DinB